MSVSGRNLVEGVCVRDARTRRRQPVVVEFVLVSPLFTPLLSDQLRAKAPGPSLPFLLNTSYYLRILDFLVTFFLTHLLTKVLRSLSCPAMVAVCERWLISMQHFAFYNAAVGSYFHSGPHEEFTMPLQARRFFMTALAVILDLSVAQSK